MSECDLVEDKEKFREAIAKLMKACKQIGGTPIGDYDRGGCSINGKSVVIDIRGPAREITVSESPHTYPHITTRITKNLKDTTVRIDEFKDGLFISFMKDHKKAASVYLYESGRYMDVELNLD